MSGFNRASSFNRGDDGALAHTQSMRTAATVTPGMDNLGPAAVGGGISGIALGVANTHDRQSGVDAVRSIEDGGNDGFTGPTERGYHTVASDNPYIPPAPGGESSETLRARDSYGSNVPFATAASAGHLSTGQVTPRQVPSIPSQRSLVDQSQSPYQSTVTAQDGPYQRNSVYSGGENPLGINPDEIADDDDDGFHYPPRKPGAAAAVESAYNPVPVEKGHFPGRHSKGNKKRGIIVGLVLAVIIVGAVVGGAVGGVVANRGNKDRSASSSSASETSTGSGSSTNTASGDTQTNGDLGKNSPEIQALMNNKNLHKVFPTMDYTPWGVQYPLCLKYPPSQNNVTRDMAVLSQLTNNVRLYGTDCNQTEMVLHAIDRLELKDMKVWLGVWLDTNTTTNNRQLEQLYKIVDNTKDTSIFNGAIIGNEALFRAGPDIATAQKNLINYMKNVKANFTKRSLDMPIATSDLGDNWNSELVQVADIVMSNVHPFFAGVTVDIAASWTWSFWQEHDVSLTKGTNKRQIISEVGWPTGGGNDCGSGNNCPNPTAGSVAGIDELNKFMSDWVCQALDNGTDYFWYVLFLFFYLSFVSVPIYIQRQFREHGRSNDIPQV